MDIPVLEMAKDPETTRRELVRCILEAKKSGSQVMVIGCMSLAFMDPAVLRHASEEGGLPLVNPIVSAVKMAEALVTMRPEIRSHCRRSSSPRLGTFISGEPRIPNPGRNDGSAADFILRQLWET